MLYLTGNGGRRLFKFSRKMLYNLLCECYFITLHVFCSHYIFLFCLIWAIHNSAPQKVCNVLANHNVRNQSTFSKRALGQPILRIVHIIGQRIADSWRRTIVKQPYCSCL